MSKTDKTRPYWVKLTDTPMVTCVPVHRHQSGECTLPENPADGLDWSPVRCFWAPSSAAAHDGQLRCACRACTGHHDRKRDRRRDRYAARARARDARGGIVDGWD